MNERNQYITLIVYSLILASIFFLDISSFHFTLWDPEGSGEGFVFPFLFYMGFCTALMTCIVRCKYAQMGKLPWLYVALFLIQLKILSMGNVVDGKTLITHLSLINEVLMLGILFHFIFFTANDLDKAIL